MAAAVLAAAQASGPPARPQILGIAHVEIQTSDLAKARAFYGGLLGFRETDPMHPAAATYMVNARQRLIIRDGLPPERDERFINVAFEANAAEMHAFLRETKHPTDAPAPPVRRLATVDPDGHAIQFVTNDRSRDEPGGPPDQRISRRILHVGLTIKDVAAADRFYKHTLGFSETWRGGRPEGTTSWINMRVPDGTDYLEYMLYPNAAPTRQQLGSAHHVALLVPDIQQALETVRARTVPGDRNHRATPNIGVNNRWQLNVFDPDGTRVEFMEPWTVR
jgi:lactoylglutathione lyase